MYFFFEAIGVKKYFFQILVMKTVRNNDNNNSQPMHMFACAYILFNDYSRPKNWIIIFKLITQTRFQFHTTTAAQKQLPLLLKWRNAQYSLQCLITYDFIYIYLYIYIYIYIHTADTLVSIMYAILIYGDGSDS